MRRSPRPRPMSHLCTPVQHQVNMYVVAASACGVSLLALAPSAEARIVYTPTHIVLSHEPLAIDLNHDGVVDFVLLDSFHRTGINTNVFGLYANPAHKNNGVEGKSFRSAQALAQGSELGSNDNFLGDFMASFCSFNGTSTICLGGNWLDVSKRYLGLRFTIRGETHYGWARLNVSYGVQQGIVATLTGYAYETVPNKPIIAGKSDDTEVVVQPATLGGLALGGK
jgi:hypothetical protein